jgi:hypothetical protein
MGRGVAVADWNTIATAAKAVLDGLASFPTTQIQKENAVHPRDSIASSLCVISFGTEQLMPGMATFGTGSDKPTVTKIYGLVFSLYLVNSPLGDVSTDVSTFPDYVQDAKQALNTATLSGASTVWNTDLVENPAWENQAFAQGVEYSEFGVNFYSAEGRNG